MSIKKLGTDGLEKVWKKVFSLIKVLTGDVDVSGKGTLQEQINKKADVEHSHSSATTSAAGFMSVSDKSKLDGIDNGANKYTHPTNAGNKHIPSGGSSGQILRWSADGTAAWGADNNTTYGVATASTLGLVKSGTDITVDSSGNVSVNDDSHNHVISNIDELQSALDGKSTIDHTHNYAGSNSPGGDANYATRLGMNGVPNSDMNSLETTNHRFMGVNLSNAPEEANWYIGDQYVHNSGWVIQRVNRFANDQKWFQRHRLNGTWCSWELDLGCCFQYAAPNQCNIWIM